MTRHRAYADQLAELVAQGLTLREVCAVMGFTYQRVVQLWKRICEDVGEKYVAD
jgi:DNA-binding CsgD family transcriptional regulator